MESLETLESVANEWQAHLVVLFLLLVTLSRSRSIRSPEASRSVGLINLVDREVLCVDGRCQAWAEWRTDSTKALEVDSSEERMEFNFVGASSSETVFRIAYQPSNVSHVRFVVVMLLTF